MAKAVGPRLVAETVKETGAAPERSSCGQEGPAGTGEAMKTPTEWAVLGLARWRDVEGLGPPAVLRPEGL